MDNSNIHILSEFVERLEDQVEAMYDNPLAHSDRAYLDKAHELSATVGKASAAVQTMKTGQLNQFADGFETNIDDLNDKLATLETAVKVVEDGAAGIQAATEVIIAVRNLFGIL